MKARAAVCWGRGEPWSIEEITVEPPGALEVTVDWAAAGLCHSDDHMRLGARVPAELDDVLYPMLGGHEGAGVISAVGPGVTALAVGDHVVANFAPVCGVCRYCATGRGFICSNNAGFMTKGQIVDGSNKHRARGRDLFVYGKLGTFAERTTVAVASVLKVDPTIPLTSACLVSCGVPTGWGSAVERGGTKPGDVVLVAGLGGLGISAVQGARIAGAAHIVGVDPLAQRRQAAERFGATESFGSLAESRESILRLTDGQGADVVILTPSIVTSELLEEAIELTGKGAVCVLTGMGPAGRSRVSLDLGMFALMNKELRGCLYGSLDPRAAVPRLLGLYQRGLLDLDGMVTTYPLHDIAEAVAASDAGLHVRGVLVTAGERQ